MSKLEWAKSAEACVSSLFSPRRAAARTRKPQDALPAGLPLSVEWWQEPGYSAAEWAVHALAGTRAFLEQYYAADRAAARARSNKPTTSS